MVFKYAAMRMCKCADYGCRCANYKYVNMQITDYMKVKRSETKNPAVYKNISRILIST
jgi:hypothetical protein